MMKTSDLTFFIIISKNKMTQINGYKICGLNSIAIIFYTLAVTCWITMLFKALISYLSTKLSCPFKSHVLQKLSVFPYTYGMLYSCNKLSYRLQNCGVAKHLPVIINATLLTFRQWNQFSGTTAHCKCACWECEHVW